MRFPFYLDKKTAVRVAQLLEADGELKAASEMWFWLSAINPYDRAPREKYGEVAYEAQQAKWPRGTIQRSRMILRLSALSFPTPKTQNAYFDNMRELLSKKTKRKQAGKLVLGIGSGRCGSTTLSGAFAALPDACATHENPPVVFWVPPEEHLQFHIERFRLLTQYFGVVFDACHSWLNTLPRLFGEFPELKVIGLHRQTEPCVESFLRQKGSGKGTINHWAALGNGVWITSPGDPWYPTYPVPTSLRSDPDSAKRSMVMRYVTEYNLALKEAANSRPDSFLLIPTEEMSDPKTSAQMSEFLGFDLRMPEKSLNVGDSTDSDNIEMTF